MPINNKPAAVSSITSHQLIQRIAVAKDLDSSTARIACWLLGVMSIIGSDTVTLSYRQIQRGFEHSLYDFPGTGSRPETIRAAFDYLNKHEWFEIGSEAPNKPRKIRVCL